MREKGVNRYKIWTSGSAFLIDIGGETPSTNEEACKKWCREHSECAKCTTLWGGGRGYEHLKSWTSRGKRWHACKKRPSREEASKSNKEACEKWCREHSECVKCSTMLWCGRRYKRLKRFKGRGENWSACKKR